MTASILVVDDDPNITASLAERLAARGYAVTTAADGAAALDALRGQPDVTLLDLEMPRVDGLGVIHGAAERGLQTTFVVITAHGTVERAVDAMKAGAYDFLEKPFTPTLVEETVRRALERTTLRRSNRALRASLDAPGLVAAHPLMTEPLAIAKRAARSDSTVLLLGESGTGKEVVARQVHAWSPRANGPFVAVNCAALAEGVLESELFGHEKGAFTGAVDRKLGKIEIAHRGTLFLDEIGEVPATFQAKLLRVLQERSFQRVGGNDDIEVDVRVLAATNRDLAQAVADGRFRDDLYYRLNVIAVRLPPLRDRGDDVLELADRFAIDLAAKLGRRVPPRLDEATRRLLRAHGWPGNVRELHNAIERALVLCDGDLVTVDDLPPELFAATDDLPAEGFHAQVEAFRKKLIVDTLAATDGHRTRAAERLGLQRTYLARLIRQYGLGDRV